MKKILLSFLIIFSLAFTYNANSTWVGKALVGIFVDVVVEAFGKAFNPSTGKTDISKLRGEINIIKNKFPEMQDSLDRITRRVDENTNIDEYKRLVNIEAKKLSERIRRNEIDISTLKRRVKILEQRKGGEEIEESKGRYLIKNYLHDASSILNMSGREKDQNMNLLWENLLSDRMKKKLPLNSFKAWWGKTVNTLSYGSIVYTGQNNLFNLDIRYGLKNGSEICKTDGISFKKEFGFWKIHDMKYGKHVQCR